MGYADAISQKRRITALSWGLVAAGGLVFLRLFNLQIVDHQKYYAAALKEHLRKYEIPASRGQIYFMDGDQKSPAALNQTLKLVTADPVYVKDKAKTAQALADVLGGNASDYYQKLSTPHTEYVVLATRVSPDVGDKLASKGLGGITVSDHQYRTYPEGELGAQVLGFVNDDGQGQYGVEGFMDSVLAGTPGLLDAKTDTNGNPIATADNIIRQPTDGSSLVLTIDRNIQAEAEQALAKGVQQYQGESGSVVIMDPYTGAIKAMANYPTFDPNNFSKVTDYSVFANHTVTDMFEPGSGFKIINMAAGLDTGAVTPDTTYNDTGEVKVDGFTIQDAEHHGFGVQTMVDVIQKSLNVGAVFVLKMMGHDPNQINQQGKDTLYSYITQHFAFGKATGVEQAGEAPGKVNSPDHSNLNYANMTFGQGISVTMIQMVDAFAAVANGGNLVQPHVVDSIIAPDGTVNKTQTKIIRSNIISQKTIAGLDNMMEQVVLHGSGWRAKLPGYNIAGKTGTAQIAKPGGGYEQNGYIGSFTGFAPVEHPRYVMMVRVVKPKIGQYAEDSTVPIFSEINQWLLKYYQVAPNQ